MKKVIALALVIIIAAIFTACKKDDENSELTTLNVTMPTATTTAQNPSELTQAADEPATMILTTAYGETMPTVVTTVFNLANEITTAIDVNPELTTGDMSIPDVFTSQITTEATTTTQPTTESTTAGTEPIDNETTAEDPDNQSDTTADEGGENQDTTIEETTVAKDPVLKDIVSSSTAVSSDGKIILDIDPNEWNGGVKTKKISIVTVEYDGKKKSVSGTVIGMTDNADNSQIIINTDELNIPEGASVNITIPAGAVVSKQGDQTSKQMIVTIGSYEKG
ncbi:MAG: hypothetical protein ACI4GY_08855 [Acutalibacteraceae bacterium]